MSSSFTSGNSSLSVRSQAVLASGKAPRLAWTITAVRTGLPAALAPAMTARTDAAAQPFWSGIVGSSLNAYLRPSPMIDAAASIGTSSGTLIWSAVVAATTVGGLADAPSMILQPSWTSCFISAGTASGLDWLSTALITTWRPRIPPSPLRSFAASCRALSVCVP